MSKCLTFPFCTLLNQVSTQILVLCLPQHHFSIPIVHFISSTLLFWKNYHLFFNREKTLCKLQSIFVYNDSIISVVGKTTVEIIEPKLYLSWILSHNRCGKSVAKHKKKACPHWTNPLFSSLYSLIKLCLLNRIRRYVLQQLL